MEVRSFVLVYKVLLCKDDKNVFSLSKPVSNNHTALLFSKCFYIISVDLEGKDTLSLFYRFEKMEMRGD